MTPGIPDPAKIEEVDGFGLGSGNSAARRHAAVVIPLLLRSPSGGHVGVREVEGDGQRRPSTRRWRWAARRGGACGTCVSPPLLGPPLYRRWGCTLPPPQGSPRVAAKGEEMAEDGVGGA
jgi:hypothetical protein